MRKILVHGGLAGGVASVAALLYSRLYEVALASDFSSVAGPGILVAANLLAGLAASAAYYGAGRQLGPRADAWFNLLFTVLTFASFLGPLLATLPARLESPELFIGLAIPLHLFPQLFWLTTKPLV